MKMSNTNDQIGNDGEDDDHAIKWNLEDILTYLEMGRYQYFTLTLFGLALAYSNISALSFVFTAADLNYRCLIPECENQTQTVDFYKNNFFVKDENAFSKCFRYPMKNESTVLNQTIILSSCRADMFDYDTSPIKCNQWIFSNEETSISSEFSINCDWEKLTIIGTLNNIGLFIGLPISGACADRYGRKVTLIVGCLFSTICGVLRSYSSSYQSFALLEFVGAVLGASVYPTAFILGMELVSCRQRPFSGMVIGNFYPLGAIAMGLVAWYCRDWRLTLRIMYLPGLLFVLYVWLIPESTRWLQAKGDYKYQIEILNKMAEINKKPLPKSAQRFLSELQTKQQHNIKNKLYYSDDIKENPGGASLSAICSNGELFSRVVLCSYCWVAVMLVFYGLSVTSVNLSSGGNKYVSFILSNFMEIPAAILTLPIMQLFGRTSSQSVVFTLTALCCFSCLLVTQNRYWLIMDLTLNMLSKLMIGISSCMIYIYTAEIFPTELRLSLHAFCSTVGRLGSMLAPQIPLLKVYYGDGAPSILFGIVSLIAAAVVLFLPETKDIRLPDTINEAQHVINKRRKGYNVIA